MAPLGAREKRAGQRREAGEQDRERDRSVGPGRLLYAVFGTKMAGTDKYPAAPFASSSASRGRGIAPVLLGRDYSARGCGRI